MMLSTLSTRYLLLRALGAASALAVLGGCAVLNLPSLPGAGSGTAPRPTAAVPPAAGASVPAAMVPAARPEPSPLRAFADVIKDAKEQPGYLGVWRKDERVWLEIPADRIGQPMLLAASVSSSVGERGLYASQMGPSWMVEWRRVGNVMQLVAKNTDFRVGNAEVALQRTLRQGFSDSLLASTLVLSHPHPERKSVLVDAAFLLSDIPSYSTLLERAYRMPYGLDRANSYFERTRADNGLTTLSAAVHFATPRIPAPPLMPTPIPLPGPPSTTPDPRSLFVGFVYSFMPLPAQPMAARVADARIGHFTEAFTDLGSDLKANPRVHYVNRWRLDKKDPTAEMSEPLKPITYWLDANIPQRYRASVEAGILEWNKAFERIGFKNAIVVKQQADDDAVDLMDSSRASIRWFTGADVGFARGPSHTDPRSGEILDADIAMSDVFARGSRRFFVEDSGAQAQPPMPGAVGFPLGRHEHTALCMYADEMSQQMHFALDLLTARGDIAPDSPEAEAFVQAVIKDTIMHEVGHTLGLKHNFKASTTVSRAQLQDKAWTDANGISGSVMDYNAYNLALQGERQGARNNTTLGPYDYWAIEYAYRPIHPDHEAADLARIAARSKDPGLAFADDGDAYTFSEGGGIDPLANTFDLGDDPLAYYRKRLALSQELWQRVQARPREPGEDPLRQRRSLLAGFRQIAAMPPLAAKYVGGMHTVRDASGREPSYRPVDPARQREALRFLADGVFSVDSFRFKPEFLAGMGPDYIEWQRAAPVSIPSVVLRMQTQTLDRLMSGGTAQRLIDLPGYLPENQRRGALSLNELYGTLQQAVWSEVKGGREIELMRRNLQREHLKRMQALIVRGAPGMPADAASLLRLHATQLQGQLRDAQGRSQGLSVETRAHLQESLATLTEVLRATMQRS
jgi:hypothetical protein